MRNCCNSEREVFRTVVLIFCLLSLAFTTTVRADFVGFTYDPITEPILSATFSGDFAALVAHRFVAGYEVNHARLRDVNGALPDCDLSDALFGVEAWPSPAQLAQGPQETGWVSAEIDASFYPALVSGQVALDFLFTDTDDALFAIDMLALTIQTGRGIVQAYYGWPVGAENNGFGIELADGADLPSAFPGVLDPTGTGFDEEISSKRTPEPATGVLLVVSALVLGRGRMRGRGA